MSTYTQNLYQIVFSTKNREEHHKTVTSRDELIELLKEHGIEFDELYLL